MVSLVYRFSMEHHTFSLVLLHFDYFCITKLAMKEDDEHELMTGLERLRSRSKPTDYVSFVPRVLVLVWKYGIRELAQFRSRFVLLARVKNWGSGEGKDGIARKSVGIPFDIVR